MCWGDREYTWKDPCSKRASGLLQKPQSWLSLRHGERHIDISTSSIFMFLTLKEISAIVSTFLRFLNFVYQFWYSMWGSTMIEHNISFIGFWDIPQGSYFSPRQAVWIPALLSCSSGMLLYFRCLTIFLISIMIHVSWPIDFLILCSNVLGIECAKWRKWVPQVKYS